MQSGRSSLIRVKRKLAKTTTCCHSLSFVVTRCYLLSLIVIRCHSLSLLEPFVVTRATRCATRCHLLSFVVTRRTSRSHSLSVDVSLVCPFMNDRSITDFFLVEKWATLEIVRIVFILAFLKLLKY